MLPFAKSLDPTPFVHIKDTSVYKTVVQRATSIPSFSNCSCNPQYETPFWQRRPTVKTKIKATRRLGRFKRFLDIFKRAIVVAIILENSWRILRTATEPESTSDSITTLWNSFKGLKYAFKVVSFDSGVLGVGR